MPLNVLLITADHMRNDALSCNAGWSNASALAHVVRTPALDRLAREGVSFANAYTPDPICVPARASITTGNYPHTCTGDKANSGRIRDDQPQLAELFADGGYATYAIGKLHYVPYAPPGTPRLLHGFQYAELNESGRMLAQFDPRGEATGIEDYHDYLRQAGWGGYQRAHGIGNNDVHPSPSPLPAEHHAEAWVAARAIAALERHQAREDGQPFLLWASFSKPHPPYDPPRPYDTLYDPRQVPPPLGTWGDEAVMQGRDPELTRRRVVYGWDRLSPQAVQASRAFYAGMVTFQDAMIGRIVDWLQARNLLEETLIVYTSDHGDLLGDFGRFFKTCMYDGSVKVPLIWRAPGLASSTCRRDQLVGLQDILPTLCALTGVSLPCQVDGQDLSPMLHDPAAPGRDRYVAETRSGRDGQKAMVRTAEWKYIYCTEEGTEELYDMRAPDGELRNLAADPAHRQARESLRASLIHWCREHGDDQLLDGGDLARTHREEEPAPSFSLGAMGWRWY
jgi:arylsulfatase A-like enzyme